MATIDMSWETKEQVVKAPEYPKRELKDFTL